MLKMLALLTLTGALAAGASVTTPTPGAAQGAERCFTTAEVHNLRGDAGRVYVRVRVSDIYEATTSGCPDQAFNDQITLRTEASAVSDRICVGDTARIVPLGSAFPPVTCRIQIQRRLTPAEVSALPVSAQP